MLPQPLFELEGDSVFPPDELAPPDPETVLAPLEACELPLLLPFVLAGDPPLPLDEPFVLPAPLDPPEELELLDPVAPLEELEPVPPPAPLASGASSDESTSPDFSAPVSSIVASITEASELPPNVMSAQ